MEVFVARQPILTKDKELWAYQLLYRNSADNYYDSSVGLDEATTELLKNSYYSFGLNKLVENSNGIITFSKELLLKDMPLLLDNKKIKIQLLLEKGEYLEEKLINKLKELKELGYEIILDDIGVLLAQQELIPFIDVLKVDLRINEKDYIEKFSKLIGNKTNLKLLAEKVETEEEFEWVKGLGFEYFQGYFFSKPSILKTKNNDKDSNSLAMLHYVRIMKEMHQLEPNFRKVSDIIEENVDLTYKLLKIVNAKFTGNRHVTSLQHAISILGIRAFESWLSVAVINSVSKSKPSELFLLSLIRANFMENYAKEADLKKYSYDMMLTGMMSLMDTMLDKSMDQITEEIPLSKEAKETLLGQKTKFTGALNLIKDLEKGDFSKVGKDEKLSDLDITAIYYDAISWADSVVAELKELN